MAPEAADTLTRLDALIAAAPAAERPGLVVALAARLAALGAGLSAAGPAPARGQNVSIKEGAKLVGTSPRYLYRHADELPFIVRVGRRRVVNTGLLDAYNRRQAGRGA